MSIWDSMCILSLLVKNVCHNRKNSEENFKMLEIRNNLIFLKRLDSIYCYLNEQTVVCFIAGTISFDVSFTVSLNVT